MNTFDFDEWATLAKSAPDQFEMRRRTYIEHAISESTDIRRMRGLQCRIDMERIRARTAMKSCLRITSLMWDSLFDCRDALNVFVNMTYRPEKKITQSMQNAKVLSFRPKCCR